MSCWAGRGGGGVTRGGGRASRPRLPTPLLSAEPSGAPPSGEGLPAGGRSASAGRTGPAGTQPQPQPGSRRRDGTRLAPSPCFPAACAWPHNHSSTQAQFLNRAAGQGKDWPRTTHSRKCSLGNWTLDHLLLTTTISCPIKRKRAQRGRAFQLKLHSKGIHSEASEPAVTWTVDAEAGGTRGRGVREGLPGGAGTKRGQRRGHSPEGRGN